MNQFRHHLGETLSVRGAPRGVLAMCHNITRFEAIHPTQERKNLYASLRDEYDEIYDVSLNRLEWEPVYTAEEANRIANAYHRYRLFTFSNFLTKPSTINRFRRNLVEILTDARPGSVILIIGGTGRNYPDIYAEIACRAKDAGFCRKIEPLRVSTSHAMMSQDIYPRQARFYRRLKHLAGVLPDHDPDASKVKHYFEGPKFIRPRKSGVHAYRK